MFELSEIKYLVEANGFESLALWSENERNPRVTWESLSAGRCSRVGDFGDMPIVVSLFCARLNGKLVAFYTSTSQVVNWNMIEAWLRENVPQCFPEGERKLACDAMNFAHCLNYVRS